MYIKNIHIYIYILIIGMYLHALEKRVLPDISKRSSLGERWEQAETYAIG